MKKAARYIFTGLMTLMLAFSCQFSKADEIGCVDVEKVLNSYSKAQDAISTMRTRETDLKQLVTKAKKEIKAAKTQKEAKKLEEKYSAMLLEKNNSYRQEQIAQLKSIENTIVNTIRTVADQKKLSIVFKKNDIITGGQDITDEVITTLNGKK